MNTQFRLGGILGAVALIGATFGFAGQSHAIPVDCPASFTTDGTAKVTHDGSTDTAASACQYLTPPSNQVANETNVNAGGFFTTTTWELVIKVDGVNALSGEWAIPSPDFNLLDYIIVFKDGNDTNLIAFLLNEEVDFGDWTTPFTEPPFDFSGSSTSHDVSHFAIFSREGEIPPPPPQVPEPATLTLFGAGLIALAMVFRRRIFTEP